MKKLIDKDKKLPGRKRFPPGSIVDVSVTGLDSEGFGVAVHENTSFSVTGALPGEEVRVKVSFSGRQNVQATAIKILRRSVNRLSTPFCSRAPACDGCALVAMSYPAQLAWKRTQVERDIRRHRSLERCTINGVIASPQETGYRCSAKLVVGGKFAAPEIGMYRRHSHEIIDISDCPLHHPLVNRIIQAVKEGVKKGKVPIYSLKSGQGILRYLVIRVSSATNRAMVVFVTARRSFNEIHHLAKHLQASVPEVAVIVQNVNSSSGNVVMGQQDHFLTTAHVLTEKVGNMTFGVSPRSFFQINTAAALLLYEKVREWGAPAGRESVIDLYCGVGGISLFLAPHVREVLGIEAVDAAVADATANAVRNGITNCRFVAGNAAALLKEVALNGSPVDLIIINPPRKGCDEEVLNHAATIAPSRIVYVSCSPFTLARDLDILAQKGYRTMAIQPVDMFPQTTHIENVALLEKR